MRAPLKTVMSTILANKKSSSTEICQYSKFLILLKKKRRRDLQSLDLSEHHMYCYKEIPKYHQYYYIDKCPQQRQPLPRTSNNNLVVYREDKFTVVKRSWVLWLLNILSYGLGSYVGRVYNYRHSFIEWDIVSLRLEFIGIILYISRALETLIVVVRDLTTVDGLLKSTIEKWLYSYGDG